MNPRPCVKSDGVAWITGGSSGIGRALALQLARQGWQVVVSARSKADLDAVAEAGEGPGAIHAAPLDVTDAAAVAETVSRIEAQHGPIALAVLNAGIYRPIRAEAPDYADYAATFAVNLNGTAACVCALAPRMVKRGRGQIAIVSSATAFGGMPTASAYGASKAGLVNMAECLRIELHRHGILVQVVTPGFVDTPAQEETEFPKPFMIGPENAAKRMVKGFASKRFEITFPRRFTWMLKAVYALPAGWYIPLVRKQTGWGKAAD
ncbi:SDR family NAD(P)-dependent oxidoreductase [Marinicauda algicola]|uniref:SDR family NAD(P)-dependent oxidoreductase n=1 Tax=Marinicauda algicola TaxID=2029849 RepID=A0A4V3RXW1_9PROT|nr:SDR family NAD(P)-dependent oxidoreductase [Marinicauda algicola]TGY87949.1 SDR family NAD(P)-dependent oxidoreductase [Marinicauda algicola]